MNEDLQKEIEELTLKERQFRKVMPTLDETSIRQESEPKSSPEQESESESQVFEIKDDQAVNLEEFENMWNALNQEKVRVESKYCTQQPISIFQEEV